MALILLLIFCNSSRSFHVVVPWTITRCTDIYYARAHLLFCSLIILFIDVVVAAAVVVCLKFLSLLAEQSKTEVRIV